MSFTGDKDSDNYVTNADDWLRIKDYIPKDKIIWSPFYCDGKQKEYFNNFRLLERSNLKKQGNCWELLQGNDRRQRHYPSICLLSSPQY